MESKQAIEYDFDAEKVMGMTREEAIFLLGDENATRVKEGLQNGTLSYSEFEKICQERFPIPQQSKLVRNVIFNQLSKAEGFNMFESNKEKQAQYAEIERFREKAENGELTPKELKQLCDKVFGEDSDLSNKIQEELVARGKVKQDTPEETYTQSQQGESRINVDKGQNKKSWELDPDQRMKIQENSIDIAQKHSEQQKQNPIREMKQSQETREYQQSNQEQVPEQQTPQQPMIDMGGMEL